MFGFTISDPIEKLILLKDLDILYPWRAIKWSAVFAGAASFIAYSGAGITSEISLVTSAVSVFALAFVAQWQRNIVRFHAFEACTELTTLDKMENYKNSTDKSSFKKGCEAANSCFETAKSLTPFYSCKNPTSFYAGYQLTTQKNDYLLINDTDNAKLVEDFIAKVLAP